MPRQVIRGFSQAELSYDQIIAITFLVDIKGYLVELRQNDQFTEPSTVFIVFTLREM